MVCLCVCQMVKPSEVNICKLYVYIAEGLMVTFQISLMKDDPAQAASSFFPDQPELKNQGSITHAVFANCGNIHARCCSLGPMYLLYILFLQALSQQEPCVEFLSWAVCYFNRLVHVDLSHKEKVAILLKMHIVQHSLAMVQSSTEDVVAVLARLLQSTASGPTSTQGIVSKGPSTIRRGSSRMTMLQRPQLLEDEHVVYLSEAADAFSFMASSLHNLYMDTVRLDAEMDTMMVIRGSYTTILLSFIATVFMPLTFFAGVFGMNFQTGADYTMNILNVSYGPDFFYFLCAVSVFLTFAYFVMNGWIEFKMWTKFVRMMRRLMCASKKTDSGVVPDTATSSSTDPIHNKQRPLSSELDAINMLDERGTSYVTSKHKEEAELEDLRRKFRRQQLLHTRMVSSDQTTQHSKSLLDPRHHSESNAITGSVGGINGIHSNKQAVRSKSFASSTAHQSSSSLQKLLLSPQSDSLSSPITPPSLA
eukprot:CAMPEP_0170064324 /NCGR_PEP_ID=MMETSP0019_2-20121128/4854_1 /TAXON_ID=98059 /ORGANISM="Dinobryon sp., Strain UTEXLB2267" /LENGTH=477 /DNA_ID=CAMNT_0010270965 /DNA_START=694 /DNA_END=2127 /DNA_ORIENTATION=-